MPAQRVTKNGKPGYRWGSKGKVYSYTAGDEVGRKKAKAKAIKQGIAIGEEK